MNTTLNVNKRVLVHLQSKATKFTVHAGTTSRQQSLESSVRLSSSLRPAREKDR